VDSLHVERMPQDKIKAVDFTELSNLVPVKQALHADNQVIEIGLDQFHQSLRMVLDIFVCDDLPIGFDEADIEVLGVQFRSIPQ
jgi:hypothetical protein